jgi:hypothetical protein
LKVSLELELVSLPDPFSSKGAVLIHDGPRLCGKIGRVVGIWWVADDDGEAVAAFDIIDSLRLMRQRGYIECQAAGEVLWRL